MAHRSRLAGFIIDCRTDDLGGAAAFWRAVLGDDEVRPTEGRYVGLAGQGALHAAVQSVEHTSRVHLDIQSDDREAERTRLEALGATLVERHPKGSTVMQAPTGQRFCLVPEHREGFALAPKEHS